MSSQAPEKAARFSAKHQLESWSRKSGVQTISAQFVLDDTSGVSVGKEIVLARVTPGFNIALDGSVTTCDGVTLQAGDIVFCNDQTAPVQNGPWVVQPDSAAWVRLDGKMEDWMLVLVYDGLDNLCSMWQSAVVMESVVGTDDLHWKRLTRDEELDTHKTVIASDSVLGHVKVDNSTIRVNGSNQIYAVPAITGSGSNSQAVMWTGTSSIGYTNQVYLSDGAGAVAVSTSARIGVGILQEGNYEALKIVRNGPGAAGYPTVLVDSQDGTDATPAVRIKKAGTGKALEATHNSHGVAASYVTSGSGTGAAVTAIEVAAESTGTPGAGFGLRHQWLLESATVPGRQAASIVVSWVTATDASRAARLTIYVADSGSANREALRAEADGSAVRLGFFGAAAVTKRAAPTAENTSTVDATYGTQERDVINNVRTRLNQVIAALQSLGLMS